MCCVDAEFRMRGGPLKVVATVGGVLLGGLFTLSFATSVSMHAFQAIVEAKKVQVRPYDFRKFHLYYSRNHTSSPKSYPLEATSRFINHNHN